ncbi:hypothetical protein ONZ43_g2582 [Nemania bipapillata]|uniref:Uncharacterized protein n=1 Tax=Nemania bipapillata TaxID=110536 RepID=A0ACC2J028_9PEZI|nr:hypothetical protein ONZ43_g2582 [Nemania bipapillata]
MTETPFTPYWRPVGPLAGPNSWVFFVVARIASRHRPVAVVSSVGDFEPVESLQGYPLIACCRRIVTIFADSANHAAIRAELALAASYYVGDGSCEYCPEPVELPEFNRMQPPRIPHPWDRTRFCEFPFIAAYLLQGVSFDAQVGRTAPALLEPLATVYRDSSIEWGMVIIDITELDVVRYGIVGFTVSMAKFIPSLAAERTPFSMGATGTGVFERGDLRVMDELRPRRAMSAAEYMAKFDYEASAYGNAAERLAQVPLVDSAAMDLVWPSDAEDNTQKPPADLSVSTGDLRPVPDQMVMQLIQETMRLDDLDISKFDKFRVIPNFQVLLGHSLIQHSERLGNMRSAGRLIRLAFTDDKHLSLERLRNLSAELLSAALDNSEIDTVTSVSLCIDNVRSTPAQLTEVLMQADTLRDIYFLQSPTRQSDALSVHLFQELAARPQLLSRANVMLAGAYSAALRKRFWLPTNLRGDAAQLAPLAVFPAQQILVRHQQFSRRGAEFSYDYIHLGDGLHKPEHFATGFLLWLSTLMPWPDQIFDSRAQLFSFSSSPASFASDLLSTAQISPILAENFALPILMPDGNTVCSPRVRDLVPGGWTVVVSQEMCQPNGISCSESYYIRYALIRPCHKRIMVDHPPPTAPGPEDLEVVGLKEFLSITAPNVDHVAIDRGLARVAKKLASGMYWEPLPSNVEPLSILTQAEAAGMLLEFLENARELKKGLRRAMKENPEGEYTLPMLRLS